MRLQVESGGVQVDLPGRAAKNLQPSTSNLQPCGMAAIEVQGLTKTFRTYKKEPGFGGAVRGLISRKFEHTTAVRDVTFNIEAGELVGFLGANGAGKTTTLKMLAGLLYPTGGEARVLGHVPSRREKEYLRRMTMVMGNRNQLQWDIPALDSFELNRAIYRLQREDFVAMRD